MFDDMMNDRITIKGIDGKVHSDICASVQGNKIYVMRTDIPIHAGDQIIRRTPANVEEVFIVEDPGFRKGSDPIPDNYQMRVRRMESKHTQSQAVIYNITGNNARFNINSIDSSTNIINQAPAEMFEALREAIRSGMSDSDDREILIAQTSEMQEHTGKASFAEKYSRFISLAANHIEIIAPFLPALSQLLMGR